MPLCCCHTCHLFHTPDKSFASFLRCAEITWFFSGTLAEALCFGFVVMFPTPTWLPGLQVVLPMTAFSAKITEGLYQTTDAIHYQTKRGKVAEGDYGQGGIYQHDDAQ